MKHTEELDLFIRVLKEMKIFDPHPRVSIRARTKFCSLLTLQNFFHLLQLSSTEHLHTSLSLAVAIVSIKSVKFLRKEKPYSVLSYSVSKRRRKRGRERKRE